MMTRGVWVPCDTLIETLDIQNSLNNEYTYNPLKAIFAMRVVKIQHLIDY